jgi:hypothetical protein
MSDLTPDADGTPLKAVPVLTVWRFARQWPGRLEKNLWARLARRQRFGSDWRRGVLARPQPGAGANDATGSFTPELARLAISSTHARHWRHCRQLGSDPGGAFIGLLQ